MLTLTGCGKEESRDGSFRKNWSFSALSFTERFSRKATGHAEGRMGGGGGEKHRMGQENRALVSPGTKGGKRETGEGREGQGRASVTWRSEAAPL